MPMVRTVAAIAAVIFLLPFASLAQQMSPQQPEAQQPPAKQTDLSESQLRLFAKVYVQVEKILKTYEPQLKQAKTPEEGQQLQNEETTKIQQALSQGGIDAQNFHRIVQIANTDDGLRNKIIAFINEEKAKS
jgi:hypothetical protein